MLVMSFDRHPSTGHSIFET